MHSSRKSILRRKFCKYKRLLIYSFTSCEWNNILFTQTEFLFRFLLCCQPECQFSPLLLLFIHLLSVSIQSYLAFAHYFTNIFSISRVIDSRMLPLGLILLLFCSPCYLAAKYGSGLIFKVFQEKLLGLENFIVHIYLVVLQLRNDPVLLETHVKPFSLLLLFKDDKVWLKIYGTEAEHSHSTILFSTLDNIYFLNW